MKPVRIGDSVYFGKWPQSENATEQLIKWNIVNESNGELLLVSDKIIEYKRFDGYCNDYEKSEIRCWLNTDFLHKAFDMNQQDLIIVSNIENLVNTNEPNKQNNNDSELYNMIMANLASEDSTIKLFNKCFSKFNKAIIKEHDSHNFVYNQISKICNDKIFLLSNEEAKKYFINDFYRKKQSTKFIQNKTSHTEWFLRSPSNDCFDRCYFVNDNGEIFSKCCISNEGGIVPVLRIRSRDVTYEF